ncbi:MAG: thioredoxin domain-containing protein [Verrucomicrobia bacterium]|jgi:hypothetical protein|nr:thioredoxin domain-containing protein [Verrucomicrobiota bacterium]
MSRDPATTRQANRLAAEKSPYLRQHACNPVDWYPWGEEAFRRARAEDKPVFLSIGYSTCHWCHVMERESFEDARVGAFLNEHFISIKVDREERPDIDKIYMTFVQATTGSGGWPMSVFLLPDLHPFYGGTYFPPEPRHGRPSFLQLLEQISRVWHTRRTEIERNAFEVQEQLAAALTRPAAGSDADLDSDLIRRAGQGLKRMYDAEHGGFGGAPKFPQPSQPELLLRYARRFDDSEATRMVLETCARMAAGGIHDQLGGGFARYSVDAAWRVPHFEKMLYDNAQLLDLYLHACLVSGNLIHAETARNLVRYVLRDMTHPEGGFYSAEDADSEGHEGKFYCWTKAELQSLLDPAELELVVRHFGITEQGNFTDHSHPSPLPGQNVLSVVDTNLTPEDTRRLAAAKARMVKAREQRVRPPLDDKILTSWNGLMLGALAQASVILGDHPLRAAAERNLAFLKTRLWDAESKTLHHRWRDGERDAVQLLDDYAFLLEGVLHLYEATLKPAHLEFAMNLADRMLAKFYDPTHGGFWQAPADSPHLILRIKEDYDGAEPSGNSVAALSLLRLAAITARNGYRQAAIKTLALFQDRLQNTPQALPRMLQAVDFALQEPYRVVICGDPDAKETRALLQAAHSIYQPHKVILGTAPPVQEFARSLSAQREPIAYVCTGTACQTPTSEASRLREMLR